jgi:hypothetical protein
MIRGADRQRLTAMEGSLLFPQSNFPDFGYAPQRKLSKDCNRPAAGALVLPLKMTRARICSTPSS